MRRVTALVLAGSRGGVDPVAQAAGVTVKAMARVGGVPMLLRVLEALRISGAVGRIVVMIDQPDLVAGLGLDYGIETLKPEAGPSASVAKALAELGTPLLVTTADHALLDPHWIGYFLKSVPKDADLGVAVARRQVVEEALPQTCRTYLRFSDGAFSGCNLFYLATPRAAGVVGLWQRVEALRKHPYRMMRLLGLATALLYAAGRLSTAGARRRLRALTGTSVALVELPWGLAAVDVDKVEDWRLADGIIRRRARRTDGQG